MIRAHARTHATFIALTFAAFLLPSCTRHKPSGPPTLRLGKNECNACGMLISEERCSAAILLTRDGAADYALFDDIGCLLDFEHNLDPKASITDRFVHDYATKQWLTADHATFLHADTSSLRTPMGSGIVAFADARAAQEARLKHGGSIVPFEQLRSEHASGTKTIVPQGP